MYGCQYEAQQTYATIQSRYWVGRTHVDLATLAHLRGNQEAAMTHCHEAHALFTALQVPKYVERIEQFACSWGVSLATR